MDGDGGTTSQSPDLDAKLRLTRTYRRLVRGTNINATSLLATDYLNHSNEVVMVLELVPDMPEIIEEAAAWPPVTYIQHFAASALSARELAIWAYEKAPTALIHARSEESRVGKEGARTRGSRGR